MESVEMSRFRKDDDLKANKTHKEKSGYEHRERVER